MLFSQFRAKSLSPPNGSYRVYTTVFDAEVTANALGSVLGNLGSKDQAALDEAWHCFQTELLSWRTRTLMIAADAAAHIRQSRSPEERSDTVVTLLFDQSGSMRGQKMLFASATADVVQELLGTLGIGYRPEPFYPVSSYVEAPEGLGTSLIALIERLLISQPDPLP